MKFSMRLLVRRIQSLVELVKVSVREKGVIGASVDGVKGSAIIMKDMAVMTYGGVKTFAGLMINARRDNSSE